MRPIRKLIIHCSDSDFGDVREIDRWHRERGFSLIGYHYLICNGHRTAISGYSTEVDGLIEYGRTVGMEGAHCYGHNRDSIGICLIGKTEFSNTQMIKLHYLVRSLMLEYRLGPKDVYGHYEFDPGKTCPNLDMDAIRAGLEEKELEHPISTEYT